MRNKNPFRSIIFRQIRNLSILLLPVLFVLQSCQSKTADNSYRFVFMTDIHVQPERKAAEGFKQAIAKVNELNPEFVITGGDLIMDALGQSFERSTQLYDLYNSLIKDFKMPVYNTIGNHEVFGLYKKSGINPDHPEYGKEMYRKRLGDNKTYFSFDHKGWHFMLLDAVGFTPERRYTADIDSLQMLWIEEDLKSVSKETPIIISTHIPFISAAAQIYNGGNKANGKRIAVGNSNKVLSLFENHNLRIVLQGHLHIVEEYIYKDIHFITGGAVSARWWRGDIEGFPEGFAVIDIQNKKDFTWHYQTYGWKAVKEEKND